MAVEILKLALAEGASQHDKRNVNWKAVLETESIAGKINQFQVDLGGSSAEQVYGEQIKLSRQTSAYDNKVCRTGDASLSICKLSCQKLLKQWITVDIVVTV
jgi:hypothetical protein